MKKHDAGQAIGILANIGVIAGIVFLAIEVGQQNTINLLSGRDAALEYFNGFRTLLVENPDLMKVWNDGMADGHLTSQESDRFDLLCASSLWGRLTLYNRQSAFGLEQEIHGIVLGIRDEIHNSEHFRRCWDGTKRNLERNGFGDFVQLVETE